MAFRKDIPSLTGLRGVAACSVLFGHALDASFAYEPTLHPFAARFAYFGMSLFFVLSGFVIHYNYADLFQTEPLKIAIRQFFVARFARLYPLYAVAIMCALPMIPVPFSKWIVLSYLTMTQSWFNFEKAIYAPTWSISTEWFFYFAFVPLTMIVVRLRNAPMAFLTIIIVVVSSLSVAHALWRDTIIAVATNWFWHSDRISYDLPTWTVYFAPYLRVLDFISGMLMAQAYRMRDIDWMPPWLLPCALLWILIVGATCVFHWAPLEVLVPNSLYIPAIAPIMLHVSARKSWLSRLLSSRVMVFLGEISYSIYIWSFFVMASLSGTFASAHPITIQYANSGLKVIAIFGLTIVTAYGSYSLIEVPARRFLREMLSRPGSSRPRPSETHQSSNRRCR